MNDLRRHEISLAALAAVLMLLAWRLEPGFVAFETQAALSTHVWELAIVCLPMLAIVITAGIDLSVGSMLALSTVAFGLAIRGGVPWWAALPIAPLVGFASGACNGLLVVKAKVHPLIVTLATMAAFRGLAEAASAGRPISGFEPAVLRLASLRFLGLPPAAWVFAGGAVVLALLLRRTRTGRTLFATGLNETAARFAALKVDRMKVLLYAFSGLACGVAGTFLLARRNTAKADLGLGLELEAITAVVLGGASVYGGRGSVLGLVLGVFLIHETREFLSWHWHDDALQMIVIGGLLVASVLIQRLPKRARKPHPVPKSS